MNKKEMEHSAKVKFITRFLMIAIAIFLFIDVFTYFKPNLYFSDKYMWYVHMGSKPFEIFNDPSDLMDSKALEYANKAVVIDSKRAEAHKLLVYYYSQNILFYGDNEDELSLLKRMNETSFYYNSIGRIMRERGMLNESLDYFKKAIKEYPYSEDSHFEIGLIFLKLGDAENALKHLNISMSLINSYNSSLPKYYSIAEIHSGLGFAYQKMGLHEKAEEEFRIAKSINSKSISRISDSIY